MSSCGFFRSEIGSTLLRFRHILKLTLADLLIIKKNVLKKNQTNYMQLNVQN